jgi:hypothetical protein
MQIGALGRQRGGRIRVCADGTDGRMGERGSDQINLGAGERGANLSTVAVKMTRAANNKTKQRERRPSSLLCKASGESVYEWMNAAWFLMPATFYTHHGSSRVGGCGGARGWRQNTSAEYYTAAAAATAAGVFWNIEHKCPSLRVRSIIEQPTPKGMPHTHT